MNKTIAVLAGDGIGPEVMNEAVRVLNRVSEKYNHQFILTEGLVGGAAYEVHKMHFPDVTKELCSKSDAILFGSVGGPVSEQHLEKWKGCEANSILALRKTYQFFANFRPARVFPSLANICPLRAEVIESGVDLLVVRELLGDVYFGEHRTEVVGGKRHAVDVCEYNEDQIRLIAHAGFKAARKRRGKVTSVDKANVLDTSKLWRAVVTEVSKEYEDVTFENMLVDNCAMQIIKNPSQFDVILTSNLFGDILSDAAAVLPGSLGLCPSASMNEQGFGLFEPSGGTAPDIAGKGIANPIAQILSVAMMLEFSFSLIEEARAIERAVNEAIKNGARTSDITLSKTDILSTSSMTDRIISYL